tara:strand:- start:303 stop:827 length:525 start_codon:yes stop_codon:yes gene_type:complete
MKAYYFNTHPKHFGINTGLNKKRFGHQIYKEPKILFLTPHKFNKNNLCPNNMLGLKVKYNLKKIVMFDRVVGSDKNILISDHINRSGISFLVEKTPYQKLPMFPDMSGVYIKKKNEVGHIVQTLGPKRFKQPPKERGVVFSEAAAITGSLWNYVGVGVRCFGVCDQKMTDLKPV